MRREGVPHEMRIEWALHADALAQLGNDLLNSPIAQRFVGRTAAGEERFSSLAAFDVQLQHQFRSDGKIDCPLLAALADDLALALLPVDVLHTQPSDLRHTAAGRDQKFHQSLFLVALASIADELQLLGRQRMPGT